MIPMGNVIAQRLHEIVANGELGFDYTFDDAKMKEILLALTEEQKENVDYGMIRIP